MGVSRPEEIVSPVTRSAGAKMPFTFSRVNAVIRAVRMSRQRERAAARMVALDGLGGGAEPADHSPEGVERA